MSMNLSRLTAVALSVAVVALTGCSSSNKTASKSSSSSSMSSSSMSGKSMSSKSAMTPRSQRSASHDITNAIRGQTFTVQLPTSNGSEYGWRLAPSSAEDKFVRLQERKQQQNATSDFPGAPSSDVVTFRANRTGQTTLTFIYDRPFGSEQAMRTFTLDVDVYKNAQTMAQANAESME